MELDVDYPDLTISDEVIAAINSGNKILAIKILREETGLGLKEAKDVVDSLARVRQKDLVADAGMTEEGGAASMIKMVLIIAIILGVYFYFFAG